MNRPRLSVVPLALALTVGGGSPALAAGGSIRPGYAAARTQWAGDALVVSGAAQNTALALAVADLRRGLASGHGETNGYRAAIDAIVDFERLPLTGVTHAQARRAQTDIAHVNRFFHLPAKVWNRGCISSGPDALAAAHAWAAEPVSTSHGVAVAPLRQAVADLTRGVHSDSGDRTCYAATIADIRSIASAPARELAASVRRTAGGGYTPVTLLGYEIAYVNAFFLSKVPLNNLRLSQP